MKIFTVLGILIGAFGLLMILPNILLLMTYDEGSMAFMGQSKSQIINNLISGFLIFVIGILCTFLPQLFKKHIMRRKAEQHLLSLNYDEAITILDEIGEIKEATRVRILKAEQRESARDYNAAIEIWEFLGEIGKAARVRKLQTEQGAVKVTQKVVHGDQVTKTEIKDSVLNRSNVGGGSDDKIAKLEKIAEMKDKGIIDDAEFKQMKKEILGK